jgi:periplasmic divalent cation tolerance protein
MRLWQSSLSSMKRSPSTIVVFSTASSHAEATRLADTLVQEKLAACVSIVPAIHSTYWWKGKIERADEALLVIKTLPGHFDQLNKRLHALHSYTVPEVLALPVVRGGAPYLAWMQDTLISKTRRSKTKRR